MFIHMMITFLFVALVTVVPTLVIFFGRIINNTKGPIPAVPITKEDDNNKTIGSTASGKDLVAPSTTRITVSSQPAPSYTQGFRRTKDRGRIAAWNASKNSPKKCRGTGLPPGWNKDLSTILTPRWDAFCKQDPQPTQTKWINSLTAPPRPLMMDPWTGEEPLITEPATDMVIDNVFEEDTQDQDPETEAQPFYTGPATSDEIDNVFAEDALDGPFYLPIDWNAEPKSVAAFAAPEAALLESSNVTRKLILKKPSILKKPWDQKEDTRTSHRRTVAWGEDQYKDIRYNWLNEEHGAWTKRDPARSSALAAELMRETQELRRTGKLTGYCTIRR